MMDFDILRAGQEQAEALTRIAFAAKRHWGYPERWLDLWAPVLTITPGFIATNEVWVAVAGEQEIGFCQGFYERMGARRVRENLYHLDGEARTLPVLEMALW